MTVSKEDLEKAEKFIKEKISKAQLKALSQKMANCPECGFNEYAPYPDKWICVRCGAIVRQIKTIEQLAKERGVDIR